MKIIFNGDDFGITRAVNYGMIDCYNKGVMRSCSLMANMEHVEHAAELMKEHPGLSVGIHLTLTVGNPLIKTHKTLIKEDGTFNKGMLKESSQVDIEEIRAECNAQIEHFIKVIGQLPTHINSHHGIEMIKGGEQVICELAKKYDLPIRGLFTRPDGNYDDMDYVVPLMKFFSIKKENQKEIDWSTSFSKVENLIHHYSKEELESDTLYEYALHPGYVDYDIYQLSSLTVGRAHDAFVFMSQEVLDWVKENNIELVTYQDLPKK